jgi:molybdopterin-guanine dinucleotide biosynthesis protein MobB
VRRWEGVDHLAGTPFVTVVGWHNAGKTLFIERLVEELKERGLRVGVLKHAGSHITMDREGTDTWRFARAGADVVAIAGPGQFAYIERSAEELLLEEALARLPKGLDLVLVEGYKSLPLPKIVVQRDEAEPAITGPGEVLATVRADGDLAPVANLLAERGDIPAVR